MDPLRLGAVLAGLAPVLLVQGQAVPLLAAFVLSAAESALRR